MTSRYFSQISFKLMNSPKVRKLSSNDIRYLYISLITNPFTTYIGIYQMRPDILTDFACLKAKQIEPSLIELINAGLIEYDFNSEMVRLIGWFDNVNGPANASVSIRMIKDFLDLEEESHSMLVQGGLEFLTQISKKYERWQDWEKALTETKKLVAHIKYISPKSIECLVTDDNQGQRSLAKTILGKFIKKLDLTQDTLSTPSAHTRQHDTRLILNERKNKLREDESIEESDLVSQSLFSAKPRNETINSALVKGMRHRF